MLRALLRKVDGLQSLIQNPGQAESGAVRKDGRSARLMAQTSSSSLGKYIQQDESQTQAPRLTLDQACPAMNHRGIQLPPTNWATDDSENSVIRSAELRTIVMRLRNRLEQAFAGQLRPGQGVWDWTYETDDHDSEQPLRCRAAVCIPAAGRSFTCSWESSQLEAQIAVSQQVADFLDVWEDHTGRDGVYVPSC